MVDVPRESALPEWQEPRLRRERATVMLLVGLVLVGVLAYVALVVVAARDLRLRAALERNESMARLSAQILDQQWDSALYVLLALAREPQLSADLRTARPERLRAPLQRAVELVPDLEAAALYDAGGKLVQPFPRDAVFAASAQDASWFRQVSQHPAPTVGEVLRLPNRAHTEVFTIALPLGQGGGSRPTGYLLALYRLGDIYSWLRKVPTAAGGAVYLVNASGQVIAASASRGQTAPAATVPPPERYGALLAAAADTAHGGPVARLLTDRATGAQSVVGYARTQKTAWALFIVQPATDAFGPSDSFLLRILPVAAPLLVLVPFAAWSLVSLYQRQHVLARELALRNEQLRRADRAKSDLLANVSHDLKTPIAGMQLSISDMRDAALAVEPRVAECLALVGGGLDQLSARVRNLLDMTRLDAGPQPTLREPCDLTDVVASALEAQRPLLRGRPLTADFPPDPLLVECDPSQMETVILNLLENAVKYSPDGSALHLSGEMRGGEATLRLRDWGPGIPPAERERVFEKFYRSPHGGAARGTGLGLAICRTIVEAHGGWIRVADAPEGSGAEFTVALPAIGPPTSGERAGQ